MLLAPYRRGESKMLCQSFTPYDIKQQLCFVFNIAITRNQTFYFYNVTLQFISLYLPNCFIAANIANFYAKWFFFAADTAVPKLFGFVAVNNNKSVFINFDLAV